MGKIQMVYDADDKTKIGYDKSVQALVEMWDENLLVVDCEAALGAKLKENDLVLVDYSPVSANVPAPRMMITKVLRGEVAKKTWKAFTDRHEQRKAETNGPGPQPGFNVR